MRQGANELEHVLMISLESLLQMKAIAINIKKCRRISFSLPPRLEAGEKILYFKPVIWGRIFQPTISESHPDGTNLVQRHEIVDDWTRIGNPKKGGNLTYIRTGTITVAC